MTVTAFMTMRDAVANALLAAPVLHTGRGSVKAGRRIPMSQYDKWGVTVNTTRHGGEAIDMRGTTIQWETTIVVSSYIRADADADAESALDPLLTAVWGRLAAMATPTGAAGITLDSTITRDLDEADQTVAAAHMALRITHLTTGSALAAA